MATSERIDNTRDYESQLRRAEKRWETAGHLSPSERAQADVKAAIAFENRFMAFYERAGAPSVETRDALMLVAAISLLSEETRR